MSITVSFEMANRMKEGGWERETELVWVNPIEGLKFLIFKSPNFKSTTPAPTFAEIWEELPEFMQHSDAIRLKKDDIGYHFNEHCEGWGIQFEFTNKGITEAAAELWLKLKQEGII